METQAKYLGCVLNKENSTLVEVRGRIREAMATLKRMHSFWRHSNCNLRFKITVIQAVLFAKVLFGLESAELTAGALKALDVFHLKCLRKVLNMKTTYVDRANTNEEVFRNAHAQMKEGEVIKPLSKIYLERKQLFYCKVATAHEEDPIKTITFQQNTLTPRIHVPRRVGRPKTKWASSEGRRLWNRMQEAQEVQVAYNEKSMEQGQQLRQYAEELIKQRKR